VLPATLDEAAQARYLRYQPQAADYLALGDFRFFRMEPARARFIGGFGRMGWVDACRRRPSSIHAPKPGCWMRSARSRPPG
jgi:hypothetical protein